MRLRVYIFLSGSQNHSVFILTETNIDFLMEIALDKIAYLPFAYVVDLVSIQTIDKSNQKFRLIVN